MKSAKRLIGFLLAAGLAAFGGYRVWEAYQKQSVHGKAASAGKTARVVSVSLTEARVGALRQELLLTGSLKPKEQVDVIAKVTGRIEKLTPQIGDLVNKGDPIAELEDDELQQQVNRAAAALAVARASAAQRQAELTNASADLERYGSLFKEGLVPKRDLETKQTAFQVVQSQVQLAKAQEKQAQAELNELRIRLDQTRIVAPMTGWVARRYVDVGALVNPTTPIINLVNLSTMVTLANVPERELGKLVVGTKATVQLDAFGDRTFTGRVARIGPVLDAATRSAAVEVEIPNPDGRLKAEMFARVVLDLQSSRQAVLIPREALVYRGEQPGVYIASSERPEFRPIQTGLTEGDDVEVLGNLAPGMKIVARGASMLTEGDRIRIAGAGRGGKKDAASE